MNEVKITGSMGEIFGVLRLPKREGPMPLVIISHGFGGTYEGNEEVAEYFTEHGFATYNYDFCGGSLESHSAGAMVDMTVLTEARDLNAVMDHFKRDARFDQIFLWGASQGGFVSSYVAGKRPEDVAALVLEFPAYVLQDDARARARADGSFAKTETVMGNPIGRGYNEAAVSFDIYDVIGGYAGDVLLLHGDADPIVPLSYAQRAIQVYHAAELVVMKGQGHGFIGDSRAEALAREAAFIQAHIA